MSIHAGSTATVAFTRPPRVLPPGYATDQIAVAEPPQPPTPPRGAMLLRLLPMMLAAAMMPIMTITYRAGSTAARNPVLLVFPVIMLLSVAATALVARRGGAADIDTDRDDYLTYLSGLRATVAKTAAAQRFALMWHHPEPDGLFTLAGDARMWERRPGDTDFGRVRIGVGTRPLATRLVSPTAGRTVGSTRVDPVTDEALRRFLDVHSAIPGLPVTLALRRSARVMLEGDPDCARALLRAMVCQLAVLHGPDLVAVTAVVAEPHREHWDWLKWLPHHQHPTATDDVGSARMRYPSLAAAEAALGRQPTGRLVVAVVDDAARGLVVLGGGDIDPGSAGPEAPAALRLRVTAVTLAVCRPDGEWPLARPDRLEPADALVCARRLAGYRPDRPLRGWSPGNEPTWPDLIEAAALIDTAGFAPQSLWERMTPRDRLCVPLGTASSGDVVRLDIKEAAENGTGPHGLCIGATGSGKSELLRTIALGMITRHSPEVLNLVLVDFKGGATFLGLDRAHHVAAIITNLAEEAPLVSRMRDALAGEVNRRQELLRAAGNFASAAAYQDARRAGAPLPALPALFVIVDEFSELLSQHPDFIDMFTAIGRLGRSLGIHLLLASQRLDEGRLRGLEAHLSYRT